MRIIKSIKFYQAVLLGRDSLMSIQPDEQVSDATLKKGYRAEVLQHGVEVSNGTVTCFVPFPNVAYVQYIEAAEPKSEPTKTPKAK